MALALPKPPKLLDVRGLPENQKALADRVWEWVSSAQDLLVALRTASGTAGAGTGSGSGSDTDKASQVLNDSGVSGGTVKDALDTLNSGKVPTTRAVNTTSPLTGGGALNSDLTLGLDVSATIPLVTLPHLLSTSFVLPAHCVSVVPDELEIADGIEFELADDAEVELLGTGDPRSQFTTRSSGRVWHPKGYVASRNPCDDLFDRGTAGAWDYKWRPWDVNLILNSYSIDTTLNMGLFVIKNRTASGDGVAGLIQAIPASEFVVYVKIHGRHSDQTSSGLLYGLVLGGDLFGTPNGAFVTAEANIASTSQPGRAIIRTWTNTTTPTSVNTLTAFLPSFLRMRVNGTSWDADASPDGIVWARINATTPQTAGFTPLTFGVFASDEDNNNTPENVYVDVFQVISGAGTSAFNATNLGGLL